MQIITLMKTACRQFILSISQSFLSLRILFVRTTVLRLAEESKTAWVDTFLKNPRLDAYKLILFEFDQLDNTPSLPGPKFVFVHYCGASFPPYIFGAMSVFVVSGPADPGVGKRFTVLNKRTLEAVRAIIAKSKNPTYHYDSK